MAIALRYTACVLCLNALLFHALHAQELPQDLPTKSGPEDLEAEAKKLMETRDPIETLRQRLGLSDDELAEIDAEVTEIVEAAVEFAKAGTDPAPEDALKNVYA